MNMSRSSRSLASKQMCQSKLPQCAIFHLLETQETNSIAIKAPPDEDLIKGVYHALAPDTREEFCAGTYFAIPGRRKSRVGERNTEVLPSASAGTRFLAEPQFMNQLTDYAK